MPNTYYKTQAIRLYLDLFEPERDCKHYVWPAIIQVLLISFGLYAFDLYLDIDLIKAYQNQENNIRNGTNITEGLLANDPENYRLSRIISIGLLIPSIAAYLILSCFYFPIPNSLRMLLNDNTAWKIFLSFFKPIIYPITYFVRHVRAETNPNSFGKNQRFEECRRLWSIIRRVEMGVENAGQLILQLWLFGPYFALINKWSWSETFQHLWSGLGHIISLTALEASFVEKMMAKFVLSSVFTCVGITIIRIQKSSETGKVIIHKSRGEVSLVEQDTIEYVS